MRVEKNRISIFVHDDDNDEVPFRIDEIMTGDYKTLIIVPNVHIIVEHAQLNESPEIIDLHHKTIVRIEGKL